MSCGQSQCGCGCSTLQGWASQSLLGSQGMSGWSGMGDTQSGEIWSGDFVSFIVEIGPQVAVNTTGGWEEFVRTTLADSGLMYDAVAQWQTGAVDMWFQVTGKANAYYATANEFENSLVATLNAALQGHWYSISVKAFRFTGLTTHNTQTGDALPPYHGPGADPNAGTTPSGNLTLQQKQDACAQQGLVYNSQSGQCECGFIDSMLVNVGLKATCQGSAFGAGTAGLAGGLGIAALLLVGFLVIKR